MGERRTVLKAMAGGALALAAPRAAATPLAATSPPPLSDAEVTTLSALGETLLPGARAAGIAAFVNAQLAAEPAQSLLMLRYLDVPPPWDSFYRAGLAALDALAAARHARPFAALTSEQASALVGEIARGQPEPWAGPPAPLFYFAVRADSVDVVYGTQAGFARLGLPYEEHLAPETPW